MQKEFLVTTSGGAIIATVVTDIAQQSFASATLTAGGIVGDNITIMEVKTVGADPAQEAETIKALAYIQRLETNTTAFATDLRQRYTWLVKTTAANGSLYTVPVLIPPTVSAGPDRTVTLPTTTANLDGTVTDPNGGTPTYLWTKVSGPAGGTISTPTAVDTAVTALQEGTYVYKLTATASGGSASDTVQVVVNPA